MPPKTLQNLAPYLPIGGVNFDADSLAVEKNHCLDIDNLQIFPYQLKTRPGLKQLGRSKQQYMDAGDWTLAQVSPATTTFDLTALAHVPIEVSSVVLEWIDGTTKWTVIDDGAGNLVDEDGDTVGAVDYATGAMEFTAWPEDADGDDYTPTETAEITALYKMDAEAYPFTDTDTSAENMSAIGAATTLPHSFDALSNLEVAKGSIRFNWSDLTPAKSFYMVDDEVGNIIDHTGTTIGSVVYSTGIITLTAWPSGATTPSGAITPACDYGDKDYALHVDLLQDPDTNDTYLFAFLQNTILKYDLANEKWDDVLNSGVSLSNITFWHTTEFTDPAIGATMIAAGSAPPAPYISESDGTTRQLLYWNRTSGEFQTLVPYMSMAEKVSEIDSADANITALTQIDDIPALTNIKTGSVMSWWGGGIQADMKFVLTGTAQAAPNAHVDDMKDASGSVMATLDRQTGIITWTAATANWPDDDQGTIFVPAELVAGADVWWEYDAELSIKPRFVFNMNNRVVMVNMYEQDANGSGGWTNATYEPWRVRWSNQQDYNEYDFDSDTVDNASGDISSYVGGVYLGDLLILYRVNSIEQMFYTGGDSVFGFRTAVNDGTYAGRTAGVLRTTQYYIGKDNIYKFDGTNAIPIGTNRIRDYLFGVANGSASTKFHCFENRKEGEWWLLVNTSADSGDYPLKAFVYKEAFDAWTVYTFPIGVTCMGSYKTRAITSVDSLEGTIDEQTWIIDSSQLEGILATPVAGTEDGYIALVDDTVGSDFGNSIASFITTRDFIARDLAHTDCWQRVFFEARSNSDNDVNVSHSTNYGENFSTATAVALSGTLADRKYWLNQVARHIRFKFACAEQLVIRLIQPSSVIREID